MKDRNPIGIVVFEQRASADCGGKSEARSEGEEVGSELRNRLCEARGGQDHGHCFSREVPSGEDQGW